MKTLLLVTTSIALLALFNTSYANCMDGRRPLMSAVLIEMTYPDYFRLKKLIAGGLQEKRIASLSEFSELKNKISLLEKVFINIDQNNTECFDKKSNAYLIDRIARFEVTGNGTMYSPGAMQDRDQEKVALDMYLSWANSGSHETPIEHFKTGQEYMQNYRELFVQVRALYPEIEAKIAQKTRERENEYAEKVAENEKLEKELAKEKERVLKLQIEQKRNEKLNAEIAAEKQKLAIKQQPPYIPNKASNIRSQAENSYAPTKNKTATQQKGDGYLKIQGVFCLSEKAFDRQVDYLARDQRQYAQGCYSSPTQQDAWLKTSSWSGTCVIERVSDERTLWTFCEDYESW